MKFDFTPSKERKCNPKKEMKKLFQMCKSENLQGEQVLSESNETVNVVRWKFPLKNRYLVEKTLFGEIGISSTDSTDNSSVSSDNGSEEEEERENIFSPSFKRRYSSTIKNEHASEAVEG
jgi:hypothetical protein